VYCQFAQTRENKLFGLARLILQDGSIIEGSFNNNVQEGWSRNIYNNGDTIIGCYRNVLLHGYYKEITKMGSE